MDLTQAVTYDWVSENLHAIISLRARRMGELMRDSGMTRSRAMLAASDEIAEKIMRPPKSGQELDTWIGKEQYKLRVKPDPIVYDPSAVNGKIHFDVLSGLEPPITHRGMKEAIWGDVFKFIRDMPRDVWKPLRFDDPATVGKASSYVSTHCTRILKCRDHGWRFTSKKDKSNPNVLWCMKMTLK